MWTILQVIYRFAKIHLKQSLIVCAQDFARSNSLLKKQKEVNTQKKTSVQCTGETSK